MSGLSPKRPPGTHEECIGRIVLILESYHMTPLETIILLAQMTGLAIGRSPRALQGAQLEVAKRAMDTACVTRNLPKSVVRDFFREGSTKPV